MFIGGKSALSRGALKPMAAAALAFTMLSSPVAAATVEYKRVVYELAFSGNDESFNSFNSAANELDLTDAAVAPWWGDEDFARGLANAYLAQIGNSVPPLGADGLDEIKFAYSISFIDPTEFVNFQRVTTGFNFVGRNSEDVNGATTDTAFVYATSITPIPLPPAGIALGLGLFSLLGLRRWKARRTI